MNCAICNDTGCVDNVFIVGDLSQAEARVVAECLKRVGHPELHNLYKDPNFDVHRWAAAPIFNCAEDEVTKYQRDVGKLSNHSGNYGAGPRVLVDKALKQGLKGIDYIFSKHILEKRHEQLPGLKKWWKDVEKQLNQTRTITTCFGRRRIFFGRFDQATYRDAYSYEPQSTVGDVCNTIFRKLWKTYKGVDIQRVFKSRTGTEALQHSNFCRRTCGLGEGWNSLRPVPLIQVHDEVVVRCPNIPELVDYTITQFKEAANIPLYICKDELLVIPIDLKIGKNWKDTKDVVFHS